MDLRGLLGATLRGFKPLRIAFHEWVEIGRDLRRAPNLRAAWGYVFGPPGWRPDGRGATSDALRAQWRAAQNEAAAQ